MTKAKNTAIITFFIVAVVTAYETWVMLNTFKTSPTRATWDGLLTIAYISLVFTILTGTIVTRPPAKDVLILTVFTAVLGIAIFYDVHVSTLFFALFHH